MTPSPWMQKEKDIGPSSPKINPADFKVFDAAVIMASMDEWAKNPSQVAASLLPIPKTVLKDVESFLEEATSYEVELTDVYTEKDEVLKAMDVTFDDAE